MTLREAKLLAPGTRVRLTGKGWRNPFVYTGRIKKFDDEVKTLWMMFGRSTTGVPVSYGKIGRIEVMLGSQGDKDGMTVKPEEERK